MADFVARQPILDRQKRIFAYELLSSGGPEVVLPAPSRKKSPRGPESSVPQPLGLPDLTQGVPGYLTFSRNLLTEQMALLLPADKVIVEIRDDVAPDDEVLRACRALRRGSYHLAFDDYVGQPGCDPLLDVATIVKVDFTKIRGGERQAIIERLRRRRLKLLAERLETPEEFAHARALGYDLFQGEFLSKPELVARAELPAGKLARLRFLSEVNQSAVDFDKLERTLKQDVGMSVKLLRYLNSAWFGLGGRVHSLRHALVLLGAQGLRQWASLIAVTELGQDKSAALVAACLLRAAFCERLAQPARLADQASNLFLIGLFSALDALIGRPLEELLSEVAVPDEVYGVLTGRASRLGTLFQLVLAYEQGDWPKVQVRCAALEISEDALPAIYSQAVKWVGPLLAA